MHGHSGDYLEEGNRAKDPKGNVHEEAHNLERRLAVLEEVGGLLGKEVADLQEDEGLNELLQDQDRVVDVAPEVDGVAEDDD